MEINREYAKAQGVSIAPLMRNVHTEIEVVDVHRVSLKEKIYEFGKRAFDIMGSLCGMIVLSPILLIIALIIYLDDKGSPVYAQRRIGKDGKEFKMYKFRSMKMGADKLENFLTPEQLEEYKKEFKLENDPRITKIGHFIRETSLDELPQMWNILKGDISVIGPRPVIAGELDNYGSNSDLFLSVKPGLTGYWQAYARNNATYETGERQQMELFYVNNRSFKLDVLIFFKTIISVVKKDGAR